MYGMNWCRPPHSNSPKMDLFILDYKKIAPENPLFIPLHTLCTRDDFQPITFMATRPKETSSSCHPGQQPKPKPNQHLPKATTSPKTPPPKDQHHNYQHQHTSTNTHLQVYKRKPQQGQHQCFRFFSYTSICLMLNGPFGASGRRRVQTYMQFH